MRILLLALPLVPTLAPAATAAEEETPTRLETIVVEAAKRPAAAGELPGTVTVLDAGRVERELAQTIDDLVRYEPGVDVVDQGSRFGFSGFSIRGIGGNRVLIEVDGVSTSSAFSIGSFSNASRDFVDVAGLKQVEISRGPASALFGSDALGGVVSFVTKGPEDYLLGADRYFDVTAGFNDVDESTVVTGTAAARGGDFSAMLRVTGRNGAERAVPGADPHDYENLNALAKVAYGAVGDGGLVLTLERFEGSSETDVDSLERVQDFTAAFGFPFVIDTQLVAADDERTRTRVSLAQEWTGGRFGTDYLRWRVYQQDSETTQATFEARESIQGSAFSAVERQRTFAFEQALIGFEVNAASDFALGPTRHQVAYGVEFERTDTEQLRDGRETDLLAGGTSAQVGPDLFPLRDFPASESTRSGVYVQDRIAWGPVTLVPALRWDRFELEPKPDAIFLEDNPGITPVGLDDDRISPKFAVLWDVGAGFQLSAQYAEGFRAPPVNDVNVGFTNFQFGYTTIPNPDLESETSRGVELGLRYGSEAFTADLALFETRYDDFIESFSPVGFDPINELLIFQSVNLEEVAITGAELRGRLAPQAFPDGLSLSFAAAHADGEDRSTGLPLNSVAPLNGVLGLDFDDPSGRFGGSFVARGAAGQDDLDESAGELLSPGGYAIFDLLGFWQPTPDLRLRAAVYNLADRDYTAYLDVQGVPASVANPQRFQRPGRHFSVALDWRF